MTKKSICDKKNYFWQKIHLWQNNLSFTKSFFIFDTKFYLRQQNLLSTNILFLFLTIFFIIEKKFYFWPRVSIFDKTFIFHKVYIFDTKFRSPKYVAHCNLLLKIKSRYEEDVHIGNHSSVWGSYWEAGSWGFACCKSTIKASYCLKSKDDPEPAEDEPKLHRSSLVPDIIKTRRRSSDKGLDEEQSTPFRRCSLVPEAVKRRSVGDSELPPPAAPPAESDSSSDSSSDDERKKKKKAKTPFFIGRTHFCTRNLGIW